MTVRLMSPEVRNLFDDDAIDQGYLPNHLVVHSTGSEAEWDRLLLRTAAQGEGEAADKQTLADPVQRRSRNFRDTCPRPNAPLKKQKPNRPTCWCEPRGCPW